MTCELKLSGSLVVGGDGCGCGGSSSGGTSSTTIRPLTLACPATQYGAIGSTDCAVTLASPNDFVPLPNASNLSSVEFLYVNANQAVTLRWNGTTPQLLGSTVVGGVTFAGGEAFDFDVNGTVVNVVFVAGSFTLAQVRDTINAAAITVGLGYLPFSLDTAGTALIFDGADKGQAQTIAVTTALALIGFGATASAAGTDPTEWTGRTFLGEFDPGVTDVEVKGTGSITVLAAGSA